MFNDNHRVIALTQLLENINNKHIIQPQSPYVNTTQNIQKPVITALQKETNTAKPRKENKAATVTNIKGTKLEISNPIIDTQ